MAKQQIPILVLPEGYERTVGRDAQSSNIMAAKAVSDAVKSTLGPKGMDKMLVDDLGDITITNDGATIVEKMKIEHPAAKMIVEVAKTQDKEVGDGTTTAMIYAGGLLENALDLLEKSVHPSVIVNGYRMAANHAVEFLNKISRKVSLNDKDVLKKIAVTSIIGKSSEGSSEHIAKICVDAISYISEKRNSSIVIDQDDIQIIKKKGESIAESELIEGVVIEKEVVHSAMPKKINNPKIALLNVAIEIKKTETKGEIEISTPEQMRAFIEQEEKMVKEMVDEIKKKGANVVFCQKGIDDLAQYYMSKYGIMAMRRVKESDMKKLSKATNARIVNSVKDLEEKDLGSAAVVEEVKIAGDELIFVRGCANPKSVSILLRGGTEHTIDETERGVKDIIGCLSSALELGKVVTGGGAVEIEVANEIRNFASTISGKEQLAINAFADVMEIIPRTLAESAGMDSIDVLVNLRKKHSEKDKDKDGVDFGVDVIEGKIANMYKNNVIEPLKTKIQAIKSASEAAEMIMRIDDVMASSKKMSAPPMGEGMGGMGGMGM